MRHERPKTELTTTSATTTRTTTSSANALTTIFPTKGFTTTSGTSVSRGHKGK